MNRKTILQVEDNPDDVVLTRRALRKAGIDNEIVVVGDGAEALDYLFGTGAYADLEAQDFPTVVLLDLKLPKMDGIEVLRRIRTNKQMKLLAVVILTSSTEEKDVRQCYELGANSYVQKPVDFDELSRVMAQLGNYWLVLNEPPLVSRRKRP